MVNESQLQAWREAWPELEILPCSTITGHGMDEVRHALWSLSGLVRVWCGDASGRPEEKPMILENGGTVTDFAAAIHKDLVGNFKFGRVWGKSARFPGQQVGPEHLLEDGDTVFLARR
jgi:ribosome-interacting GTPase 1